MVKNILTRLYEHVLEGNSDAVSTITTILEYPGSSVDVQEKPEDFLNYLHEKFDILDWFETRLLFDSLLGVQLPRLFDEHLEGATTVEQFEKLMAPYITDAVAEDASNEN